MEVASFWGARLFLAAQQGHAAVVALLWQHGAVVDTRLRTGRTPLHTAVEGGHDDVVRVLLGARADVNCADQDGATPLLIAAAAGREAIALALLEAGADTEKMRRYGRHASDRETPLYVAAGAMQCRVRVIHFFLSIQRFGFRCSMLICEYHYD